MPTIEFDETQFKSKEELFKALYPEDETDPRSMWYKRVLVRPTIRWRRVALFILIPLLVSGSAVWALHAAGVSLRITIAAVLLFWAVYLSATAKRAVICTIRIYQRYAPDSVRNKCRFEPSCSQYMIESIQKHGLFAGMRKGVRRLKRCNVRDGGFDPP